MKYLKGQRHRKHQWKFKKQLSEAYRQQEQTLLENSKKNKSPNKITHSTGGENSEKVRIPDPQILSYKDLSKTKRTKRNEQFQ